MAEKNIPLIKLSSIGKISPKKDIKVGLFVTDSCKYNIVNIRSLE